MLNGVLGFAAVCAALCALACGGGEPPAEANTGAAKEAAKPAAAPAPAAPPAKLDPSAPASKRIVGRYLLSLSEVPSAQLSKQMAELKRQGKFDQMPRVEYTVTATEFISETYGGLGRKSDSFSYEILSESGDELQLRKHAASGPPADVKVLVLPDEIYLNADAPNRVRLQRIE